MKASVRVVFVVLRRIGQDGRYAAVGGRTMGQSFPIAGREVFVVDRDTGTTMSRVYGNRGSLSGDGRYLAHESAYL